MPSSPLYVAIDVGTGSVRAALFTHTGEKLTSTSRDIKTRNLQQNHYEQSTDDIWRATVHCVRTVVQKLSQASHSNDYIAAIGIDATCSLVACHDNEKYTPLCITARSDVTSLATDDVDNDCDTEGVDDVYDVILWQDHRAIAEADYINNIENTYVKSVVYNFGGIISPENEPPKLLWLLRHKPEVIEKGMFFDLADWVAFKLTGRVDARSSCTLACKWGWGAHQNGDGTQDPARKEDGKWEPGFWQALGLDQLAAEDYRKIGRTIISPGCPFGTVSKAVSQELGVTAACIVASPMIDAYAGSVWSLGMDGGTDEEGGTRIAQASKHMNMVCGTSTCFLQMSAQRLFVGGVWGPFRDAIVKGFYVTEGGQTVSGNLMEHVVKTHASYAGLKQRVGEAHVYDALAEMTESKVRCGEEDPALHVHVLDYHAGNRSPIGDPTLAGCYIGETLQSDNWDLAVKFRATVQALCYGARHIMDEMCKGGYEIDVITACGGVCKSRMFLSELADCLGKKVMLCGEEDTVLLGGGILGRMAHCWREGEEDRASSLIMTAREMSSSGDVIVPNEMRREFHDRKYLVYRRMHEDYVEYRRIMRGEQDE